MDQMCVDISAQAYEHECTFWSALTGWERRPGSRPEFEYLVRPPAVPLRLLLQRLDDNCPQPCRAHLDLACDDVLAERVRHQALGAVVVREMPNWTTLLDPTGLAYCVTRRHPGNGDALTARPGVSPVVRSGCSRYRHLLPTLKAGRARAPSQRPAVGRRGPRPGRRPWVAGPLRHRVLAMLGAAGSLNPSWSRRAPPAPRELGPARGTYTKALRAKPVHDGMPVPSMSRCGAWIPGRG